MLLNSFIAANEVCRDKTVFAVGSMDKQDTCGDIAIRVIRAPEVYFDSNGGWELLALHVGEVHLPQLYLNSCI